jgi:hypothetical protein
MRAVSRTAHPHRGTFTSDLLSSLLAAGPSQPLEILVETPKQLTSDELQILVGVVLLAISLGGLVLLLVLFA